MKPLRDPYFIACTVLFALSALAWGWALPAFEAPDEQNHYRYMVFLKDHGRLPVQLPLPPEVAGEGHQPPLYYALGAAYLRAFHPAAVFIEPPLRADVWFNRQPVYFKADLSGGPSNPLPQHQPVHALRALQVALPLLSLACLWLLLARLEAAPWARRSAYAMLALNPGWCFLAGALNNDHLAVAASSAALLLLCDAGLRGSFRPWTAPWVAAALSAGALAKLSVLPLLPIAVACAWAWSPRPRRDLGWLLLLPGALAGWWYVRNLALYDDPFGWAMHRLTCANTLHAKSVFNFAWWRFWTLRSFESFWSVFGWLTWRAPLAFTYTVFAGCVAALVGTFMGSLSPEWRRARRVLLGAALLLLLGVARFGLEFDPPEGRYFYPALLPIGATLALGWGKFKAPLLTPWLLAAALAVLNAWLIGWKLIPIYYAQ